MSDDSKQTEKRELTAEDIAQLKELDEALTRFEGQKRWSDYIRTLVKKADLVVDVEEKVDLLTRAGALYVERSANQAEAIKCYERVLELDARHREAIGRLKEMYEKRRDWERLIHVMRLEADLLEEGDRLLRYHELAKLATERVKKPQVCVELWQLVLREDKENPEALNALAGLHERAREWGPLAEVLEKLNAQITDPNELKAGLQKLGLIYADKLNEDEGAVRTFTKLLEIDPEDKRAQEQLKRRYVSLRAWDKLDEFYAAQGKWDELIRVFEREAETPETPKDVQIDLNFRIAKLWAEKKDKADRAAKAYEKVLSLDDANLDAAEALSPIYEAAGDAANLARVYEVRLTHMEDPGDRVALLRETAMLYETKLGKADLAFDGYLEAFTTDPSQEVLREDVQRAAGAVNGWDRLAKAYEQAIKKADSEQDQLELRSYFGTTLQKLGRVDDAIKQFREVYDQRPDHAGAIAALGELYRAKGDHKELLDIYERRLELEDASEVRKQLAYGRAQLFQHELKSPAKAVTAFKEIIEEFGDEEVPAYEALDALYEASGDHKELAGVLERRIDASGGDLEAVAALKFRLGRLLESELGDKERAVETYREVLTLAPSHDGARAALEALLDDRDVGPVAAEILEPIYEERAEWSSLVHALEVLAKSERDAERKHGLLTKIADVQGVRLSDSKKSFDALGRAFEAVPSHSETLERLEMLAVEDERFEDLVALVAARAGAADDPSLARSLWLKAAEFYAAQLGNVDGAVGAYEKILAQDPGDLDVLDRLENLHRRTERWSALVDVLRKKTQQIADADTQQTLFAQMAHIYDEMLQQPAQAIAVLSEVLDLDPTNVAALTNLDRLYERQGLWSELVDNIDRQLALTDDADRQVALKLRAAAIREKHMASTEAALEIYRDVLAQDSTNTEALTALERLLADEKHQLAAAEILEPVFLEANAFEDLIAVHEIQIRHATSTDRKVELLHRIGELHEMALDNVTNAFLAFARAFAIDSSNPTTQQHLERLGDATGDHLTLVKVYQDQVASVEDEQQKAELFAKIARVKHERLRDIPGAIASYQQVLEVDDMNVDAATALEQLFQESEQYDQLAGIYRRKASMIPDPDARKAYLFRAAAAYEELLHDDGEAVRTYELALEVDPEDVGALDKLAEIHRRAGAWAPLLNALSRKTDAVADPDVKRALLSESGAVYETQLKDTDKAIDAYQRVLEIDPEDRNALARLDALYAASGNWQELLSVLERQSELQTDADAAIAFQFRVAELWRKQLKDPGRAVDIHREILSAVPESEASRGALEQMMDAGEEAMEAANVLEPVYRSEGQWAALVRVMEVQVANDDDPVRRVELLHQVAQLYELQLGDARRALDAFARALPLEPDNEITVGSLERLAEQLDAWAEVGALYDTTSAALDSNAELQSMLATRAAQLYELQLGDAQKAIERYRTVLTIDDSRVDAIESLERLYEGTERWEDLAGILPRAIDVATSPEAILDLQFKLGQIEQHRLGRVDAAIAHYREIIGAAPEYTPALSALESLFAEGVKPAEIAEILEPHYRMQEQWEKLVQVHERQLNGVRDLADRVSLMHRIAETAEERAGEPAIAFHWMQRALSEDPSHDHSLSDVERLAQGLDGWAELAGTYASIAGDARHEGKLRVNVGKRAARVYREELDDIGRAEEMYRFVLGIDPTDADSLAALTEIYEHFGAHEALATTLRRRIGVVEFPDDKVQLTYQLGQVLQHDLRREGEAIEVYNQVLSSLEPEHTESIRALESIYAAREDWPMLYQTFEKERKVVHGDQAQSEVLARMAYIAFHTLKDANKAVELWRQVLDLRGEDAEALSALGDVLASEGRYEELVDVLEREAGVAEDDAHRIAIAGDLARVWYEKLGKERNALEAWERVFDIDPANRDALYNIAEIHSAKGNQQEYADTLQRIIDVASGVMDEAELSEVYMRLGYVFYAKMEQPADAVEAYQRAIALNPRNHAALDAMEFIHRKESAWEQAIEIMERRVRALSSPMSVRAQLLSIAAMWEGEAGDPDKATSAYQRMLEADPSDEHSFGKLERLHADAGRWEELVEMYLARYETAEENAARIALLQKIAHIYESKLDDGPNAYEALKAAWEIDFTNKSVAQDLEKVTRETNNWNDLLTNANNWLREVTDPDIKIAICLNCARWYGTGIGRRDYAIPYFEQINQLDPNNVESKQQLAELYHTTQQFDHERQVLEGLVTLTSDPNVKADTYVKIGDLCRGPLGLEDQAQAYYQNALAESPSHVPALDALAAVHREQHQWSELLSVLKRKVKALTEPEEVAAAKIEVATVYETQLGSTEDAIRTFGEVRAVDPTNLIALRGLDRLFTQGERWHELAEVLEAEAGVVTTERDRIAVLTRLASMFETEFVKPEKAVERLEQVIEIDPHHVAALEGLGRLYRQLQQWEQLMATYERHVEATPERDAKKRLYQAMAELFAHELANADRAVDCYLAALDIDDNDVNSLDGLTRVYEKRGDYSQALEMMDRVASIGIDHARQVDLRYRMGRIQEEQLGDRVSAIDNFRLAIDLEPGHVPSLEALGRIYKDSSDWLSAARVLEQEAQYRDNPRVAAKTLVDLGRLLDEQLEDHGKAIAIFEQAYAKDSDNEEAAFPLAIEYVDLERWPAAFPILSTLFLRSEKRDVEEQKRIAMMYGSVASKVGEKGEAVKAFARAYHLDAQDLQALLSLAIAHFDAADWAEAFKYFQMVLVHHRDSLSKTESTDIFYRLGVVKREQAEPKKALNMFDKALEEDSFHRPTLEAVVALYQSQGEWEKVIHYKRQLVEVADTNDDRFALLLEVGDLWSDKVKNKQKAIQSYTDASDVKPEDHRVLHKLLILYQETKQWDLAIKVIQQISDGNDSGVAKAKYAYTSGVILRDEIKDLEQAALKFEEALDLNSGELRAFEAINKLHTVRKDWKALDRAFRKMLKRIAGQGNTELQHFLAYNLGVIHRDRLQNYETAAESFKLAATFKPEDEKTHQILAELYSMMPNRAEDAIAEHQELLRKDPQRVDSYRALYRLYFDTQNFDKAWCLAAALSFLGKADAEQKKFYEQYKPAAVSMTARLDNNGWVKDVFHPDESLYVGKLLEPLSVAILAAKASSDKSLHLVSKYLVTDPMNHSAVFPKLYAFVAQALNLQLVPRLFLRPDQPGGFIHVAGSNPPAMVCLSTLLTGFSYQQLGFVIGRQLAYYRGEHFIRTLITSHTELKTILVAGLQIGGAVPPTPEVQQTALALQSKLGPAQVDALRAIAKLFVEAEPNADVKRWIQSVELTACRAGFLFCNDLMVAAQMIQSLPAETTVDLPPKEKIKELVLFSVSEQYFRLRKNLGLQIKDLRGRAAAGSH